MTLKKHTIFMITYILIAVSINGQDVVFRLDEVPNIEDTQVIKEREQKLQNIYDNYLLKLQNAVDNNEVEAWLNDHTLMDVDVSVISGGGSGSAWDVREKAYDLFYHTQLALEYNFPELIPAIVELTEQCFDEAYTIFLNEFAKASNQVRDLGTTHPANAFMTCAYILKQTASLSLEKDAQVKYFLTNYIENLSPNTYFKSNYKTTGYNKEVMAIEIASWMLLTYPYEDYASGTYPWPNTRGSFESVWDNVINQSYDGDNSPHYDASTGFNAILRMGILHGREDEMKNSIHIQRIIDRMARTVMSSGQAAIWGKSMEKTFGLGYEKYMDGGPDIPWCMMIGYRLFENPYYLYVGRKYDAMRKLNLAKRVSSTFGESTDQVFLWPHLPAYNNSTYHYPTIPLWEVKTANPQDELPLSFTTDRITSSTAYGGGSYPNGGALLGRGDENYLTVQDKLVLSTGHHVHAPYMLMDLSFSQSKGAVDHRMGIDNFIFKGVHLATRSGRGGEANKQSTLFISPLKGSVSKKDIDYPIIDVASILAGDNNSTYWREMGYKNGDAYDAYDIDSYIAETLESGAAYGKINYSTYQYDGIEAQREMILLNNGILAMMDRIDVAGNFIGSRYAGTIFQLWPAIEQSDKNYQWVLQQKHYGTETDVDLRGEEIYTLFYFPNCSQDNDRIKGVKKDSRNLRDIIVYSNHEIIQSGSRLRIPSLIIPIKDKTKVKELTDAIEVVEKESEYSIIIPYEGERKIIITFYDDKAATFELGVHTGIKEFSVGNNSVSMFPNPIKGETQKLNIDFKNEFVGAKIVSVYNALGHKLIEHQTDLTKIALDISTLKTKGIYFLSIKSESQVVTKQFVVQ